MIYITVRIDTLIERTKTGQIALLRTKNPGEIACCCAIKIVGKNDFGAAHSPVCILTMKAPTYDPKLSEAAANNTFSVIYNDEVKLQRPMLFLTS